MALHWNAAGALEPCRVRFLGQSCIGLRLVPWSLARFDSSFLGQSYQEGPFRPVRKNISLAATPKKAGVGCCNANAVATPTALCTSMASVSMLCRVRLRAIRSEILVRNCRTFSRLQNFAFEIARNRAQIHAVWWCAASLRSLEVLNICCERQHAVPREISCDSERISNRNFRKFSRPQNFSFDIARDRAEIHAAW